MKTLPLILIALTGVAVASCSDDEPLEVRQSTESISFRSGMKSRASETTNANLKSIYVTAFNGTKPYFENVNFERGADSYFTSASRYDWLENNETLQFFAYAPSQTELGADITNVDGKAGLKLENFSVPDQIADQVDFITANASGNKKQNAETGVELTFDHRLAQIEIQAKSENKTYTYKVAGVRIGRAEFMGTFDFTTNEWTLDDWHDTAVYDATCDEITLTAEPQSIMGPSGNAMLLPQTLTPWDFKGDPDNVARDSYLSVLVRILRTDNGYVMYPFDTDTQKDATGQKRQYAWASIPLSGTWEQGKKYIYTLDFTDGAGVVDPDDPTPGEPVLGSIKFSVNVEQWVDTPAGIPMTPTYTK
ncbi:MAG: fimbrillin family protein [Muribaculaceae bacterium]|nr:fimbrillin family protein [Muribaculaceae bacterium]